MQDDYVEQRDRCREYAQLKLDMAMRNADDPSAGDTRKSKLVQLFSECMANNGWSVPSGKEESSEGPSLAPVIGSTPMAQATTSHAAPRPLPPPPPVAVSATENANRAFLARKSECDFARQAASVSTISANRAKACDLECDQRLAAAPEAPRPAACPSETPDSLSTGSERD